MQIGIIVNHLSRHNQRHPESADAYEAIGDGLVHVECPDNIEDLSRIAREFKGKKVPFLGISGGDGTIHQVVSVFINEYYPEPIPHILLLGDGTMNNIAHSIGMSAGGKRVLTRFLSKLEDGALCIQKRNTLVINEKHCFLFGCGLVTNFLLEAYRGGHKGLFRNIVVIWMSSIEAIKSIFMKDRSAFKIMKPLEADIFVEGKRLPMKSIHGILAGTVEKIGMGMRPLSKARKTAGHFHLIATETSPVEILFNVIPIGAGIGLPLGDKRYFDMTANEFEIHSRLPFEYTMDGDMYSSDGVLKVEVGQEVSFVVV
jgi:diacylglycerol kinase family enzyme